ncbi:MAG: phosphoribosylanthranilate isomerase [Pseudonocardiaceae bacterium]
MSESGRAGDAPQAPWVKVCGATRLADIELLAGAGADLVGLWHGVPDGHAELDTSRLVALAQAAAATSRLRPVLVTLQATAAAIHPVLSAAGLRWVQLHGFQPPGTVHALKTADSGLRVIKVLHLRGGSCLEQPLIRAYQRAGTDYFLFDSVTADGRLGSTAQVLDVAAVLALADLVSIPFLLAGGITADRAAQLREVSDHPRFLGVDVDTGARDADRRFDRARIVDIRRSWPALHTVEAAR